LNTHAVENIEQEVKEGGEEKGEDKKVRTEDEGVKGDDVFKKK
jgi:hypothetical protein